LASALVTARDSPRDQEIQIIQENPGYRHHAEARITDVVQISGTVTSATKIRVIGERRLTIKLTLTGLVDISPLRPEIRD
jgi:hypothetical protein